MKKRVQESKNVHVCERGVAKETFTNKPGKFVAVTDGLQKLRVPLSDSDGRIIQGRSGSAKKSRTGEDVFYLVSQMWVFYSVSAEKVKECVQAK